ncbi:MAG: alpha/beta hydrolase [Actinomycetota bacterium]
MRAGLPDGAEVDYDLQGDGPVVAFVHPGLWDRRTWDPQVPTFTAAGFRVLRHDLRGYGRSSRPVAGERFAHWEDLVAVLDHAGVERAALVGCSIGGGAAIEAAIARPDRVWALVPVAPGLAGLESTAEDEAWYEEHAPNYDELLAAGDLEAVQDLELGVWAPLGTDDPAGSLIKAIARENIHTLAMDSSGEVHLDPAAAGRLGSITAATLVVEAQHDPPDMRRIIELLADQIPGARRVTIAADHVVNLRRPEAFDAEVIPFLQEHAPR